MIRKKGEMSGKGFDVETPRLVKPTTEGEEWYRHVKDYPNEPKQATRGKRTARFK